VEYSIFSLNFDIPMRLITVDQPKVHLNSINPELIFDIKYSWPQGSEIPIEISGEIRAVDGKKISNIIQQLKRTTFDLDSICLHDSKEEECYFQMIAPLNEKALDYIDNLRNSDSKKDVQLLLDLKIRVVKSRIEYFNLNEQHPNNPMNVLAGDLLKMETFHDQSQVIIAASNWVLDYLPALGRNRVLLLELNLPDIKDNGEWKDIIGRALKNINDMEQRMKEGEWELVMLGARKLSEIFKFNKKNESENKEKFRKLFEANNYSIDGFDQLFAGIENVFLFASKFIHDKDQQGNLNPIPIPKKEDAYFIYSFCVGMLNMINKKISK
jgi:hypothetical protein